jgi:hypothetical protein
MSKPRPPGDRDTLVAALESAGCKVRAPHGDRNAAVVCAFHGDHNASGSIYEGEDRRWRYKCHSCDAKGDAADIEALHTNRPLAEVLKSKSTADQPKPKADAEPKQTFATVEELIATIRNVAAVYDYSPSGLRVIRTKTKSFPQAHQTEDGRWSFGGVPDPQPLYHAADLGDGPVIVTEGEKDADALRSIGIAATTAPMGADTVGTPIEQDGKPGKADWSALAGRHVIIWGDADEPGQRHAERLMRVIARVEPRSLRLMPSTGHKDAADFIAAHGDEARAMIEGLAAQAAAADAMLAGLLGTDTTEPTEPAAPAQISTEQPPQPVAHPREHLPWHGDEAERKKVALKILNDDPMLRSGDLSEELRQFFTVCVDACGIGSAHNTLRAVFTAMRKPTWTDDKVREARVAVLAAPPERERGWLLPRLTATGMVPGLKLGMCWFKDTVETKPEWIWQHHLAKRCTHVLGGKQGHMKGLVTVDIAARVTRGDCMPDGSPCIDPGKVLFVTREDDPSMALLPRLRVAGADLSLVAWTHGDFSDGQPTDGMASTATLIAEAIRKFDFQLVFIDPLGAWVEDDSNNAAQIRAVIDPLNRVARETGACICFVAHLRKAAADDPMDAFAGSAQVTAAVRSAMLIAPVSETDRMLTVVKTNFKRPASPCVFTPVSGSTDPEDPPRLKWRAADQTDRLAAQASRNGQTIVVPLDKVLPHVPATHKPLDEVARAIRKALLVDNPRVTLSAVKDAMLGLVEAGQAHEGTGRGNARTIGLSPANHEASALDRAVAIWEAHPDYSVRQVSLAAACSVGIAHRAKGIAKCSVAPVQCSVDDRVNSEQTTEHNAVSVHSLPGAPIGSPGASEHEHSGMAGERKHKAPSASEDLFLDPNDPPVAVAVAEPEPQVADPAPAAPGRRRVVL